MDKWKYWLGLWGICYAVMMSLVYFNSYNILGGYIGTTAWYFGLGLPVIWGLKKTEKGEE